MPTRFVRSGKDGGCGETSTAGLVEVYAIQLLKFKPELIGKGLDGSSAGCPEWCERPYIDADA